MGILVDLTDDEAKRLRLRATEHGLSVEEEVKKILTDSLGPAPKPTAQPGEQDNLYDQIRADVEKFGGGFDFKLPKRHEMREPPDFNDPKYDRLNRDDHS